MADAPAPGRPPQKPDGPALPATPGSGPATAAACGAGECGILVFVYGTLKRGEANHHWLGTARGLGEAEIRGLVLHDLGPFPMAVAGDGRVHGELYAVDPDGLRRLDQLEGHPRLYERRRFPLGDGRQAWVYLGRPRQVRFSPRLADGRWPPLSGPAAQQRPDRDHPREPG